MCITNVSNECERPHHQGNPTMRRSSRIQIKQEGSGAGSKSELSQPNRLTPRKACLPERTIKVLSPKKKGQKKRVQAPLPLNSKKQSKTNKPQNKNSGGSTVKTSKSNSDGADTSLDGIPSLSDSSKPKNIEENPRKTSSEHLPEKSNEKASLSGKTAKNESIRLMIQDDSNDSILSDVAHSLKLDRTIKNLSPRKFFHNKDPKTTRSGRSFSPYDFASYSALFGSICANQANKTKPESKAGVVNLIKREKHAVQSDKRNKHKKAVRCDKRETLKSVKKSKKPIKKYTKKVIEPPVEFEQISGVVSEVDIISPVVTEKELAPTEKRYAIHFSDASKEDDIFSEKVPALFWMDFPFTRFPMVASHSLPAEFWESGEGSIPVCNWEMCSKWREPKKPGDMAALSKVSLADVDKYEFKSVFKDVSLQLANFEELCGEWNPSPAYGKFDVMEAESADGRRFYRKRITDTRLIAWHKYNLASSTKYCSEEDLPKRRPVIKVRFNQCHKAELMWRLSETQPPPSIEEIFNGPVVHHPVPKHTTTK